MQTLQQQQTFKIEEKERKDSMLEILSDKYCRIILESIMYTPVCNGNNCRCKDPNEYSIPKDPDPPR